MIRAESSLRLRPSVAFVPLRDGNYQFFQGNTRRQRTYRLSPELAAAIRLFDGVRTITEIAKLTGAELDRLMLLTRQLVDQCLIEDSAVAARICESIWRRPLNFLADFYPSSEVEQQFHRLQESNVVLLGCGAVGSWVAIQLAQSGVQHFRLIDSDVVERSNLNRSLFLASDVGHLKTEALSRHLRAISPTIELQAINLEISDPNDLAQIVLPLGPSTIIVNCADSPSVDFTSALVDAVSQEIKVPYVIAGGYNLHLSLIGMSVIPGESACYQCGRLTLDELQKGELADLKKLVRPWRNIGNLGPLAAITASFAANEVIRLAVGSTRLTPTMLNRRGEFNFLTNELHFVELPRREDCECMAAQS